METKEEILLKYKLDTDHFADQEYSENGIYKAMDEYAELYHQNMVKAKKVVITSFDNPNRWYRHFIGTTFNVVENDGLPSYIVSGMLSKDSTVYRIEKCDCRALL